MYYISPSSPYLPVATSWLPFFTAMAVFGVAISTILTLHCPAAMEPWLYIKCVLCLIATVFTWWRDLTRESLIGYHTSKLELALRLGMLLFILSEVFFFVAFFWAFYDSALSPSVEIGMMWPPLGITPLEVYSIPLLNTVILLSSGITITWAHHAIMSNLYFPAVFSLTFTVLLGIYFLYMQYLEYIESSFTIADGIYGSTFFVSTGFHGFHVIVGATFLSYVLMLMLRGELLYNHHFSFEAAAWYWHFVDVVWLFLYLSIYWWGSM